MKEFWLLYIYIRSEMSKTNKIKKQRKRKVKSKTNDCRIKKENKKKKILFY